MCFIERKGGTVLIFSLQYYPRMALSSFGTAYFIPIGWRTIRIRIKCVQDNPIVWINAWKYNGKQVICPSRPEKRASVYAASSLGLLIDYNVKSIGIRPWRIFRSLYRNGATKLLFALRNKAN